MKLKYTITMALLLVINAGIQAQKQSFGKVSREALEMTKYDKFPNAEALVLFDVGKTSIDYVATWPLTVTERHRRIKIFSKEGYKWADIGIRYRANVSHDKIRNLKAKVYWLENGQVKSQKLSRKDFMEEKVSKYWKVKKLVFPKIKEGAIIEYSYKRVTPLSINLSSWYFQTDIPVKFSQYTTEIPTKFFEYVKIIQDYGWIRQVLANTNKRVFFGPERVNANVNKWEARDVPRFVKEKYMTSRSNHIAKVEFQLKRLRDRDFFSTWKELDKRLNESDYFGNALKKKNFGSEILSKLKKLPANKAKAQQLFEAVKAKMKYNKQESRYVNTTLRKAYLKGEGNAGDINLMLINLLQRAGFKQTFPIILSTRSHDRINRFYPLLNKFNYVIALLVVDKKAYFLDATDRLMPFGLLPSRCLSGVGRVIARYEMQNPWVEINQGHQKYKENIAAEFTLNEDGLLTGNITTTDDGYSALIERHKIDDRKKRSGKKDPNKEGEKKEEEQATENYEEDEKVDLKGLNITKVKVENLEALDKPLSTKLEATIEDKVQKAGNLMYLNPMFYWKLKENPFKLKERKFPVDFGYHIKRNFYVKITLPKGYQVESLPQQMKITLPGRQAVYTYSAQQLGDALLVNSRLSINQTQFKPEQYQALKQFFEKMVAKQAEQVVLKKK